MMQADSSNDRSTCAAAPSGSCDDLALVNACKDGDEASFAQLVKRYDGRLFGIAQSITDSRSDAEDAVREAFLNAFRNMTEFNEESRVSTWLIRMTVNEALARFRQRGSMPDLSIYEDLQGHKDTFPLAFDDWVAKPEELYRGDELRDILKVALRWLRPGLRIVFVLRDIAGISTNEAAEALVLSSAAVNLRLWMARLLLRERLSKYFGAGSQKYERRSVRPVAEGAGPED